MQELKMEVTISLRQNDKNIKQDKKRMYIDIYLWVRTEIRPHKDAEDEHEC